MNGIATQYGIFTSVFVIGLVLIILFCFGAILCGNYMLITSFYYFLIAQVIYRLNDTYPLVHYFFNECDTQCMETSLN